MYLFNGKELDEETGLYYYGARYYDPVTSVWASVEPYADMYPHISPYVFVNNNPVIYHDPDGTFIDISHLLKWDRGTAIRLMTELRYITGIHLYIDHDTKRLEYFKDENGKPKYIPGGDKRTGSRRARKIIQELIDGGQRTQLIKAPFGGPTANIRGTNLMQWNPRDIAMLQGGLSRDMNKMTFGYGIVFFHEIRHSNWGGGGIDPAQSYDAAGSANGDVGGDPGPQARYANVIRRQFERDTRRNGGGKSMGQRRSYGFFKVNGDNYMAMSRKSARLLRNDKVPNKDYLKL